MSVSSEVFVIGESLVDIVRSGTRTSAASGGSPRNVAYGLGRLGVPTTLSSIIGLDANGATITRELHEAGVTVTSGSVRRGRTSTAVAHLNAAGDAHYDFDIEWDWHAEPVPAGTAVVHTGSIASTLQPGAEAVLSAFASLKEDRERPPLLTFDPNVRPSLIESADRTNALIREFAARSDVVKMSHEDAQWLHPGVAVDAVFESYLLAGAGLVVITMGAAGCAFATPAGAARFPAVPVEVVDTIGGGDAFTSGLIFGLLRMGITNRQRLDAASPDQVGAAAATALLSSAATVARAGAMPPALSELELSSVLPAGG